MRKKGPRKLKNEEMMPQKLKIKLQGAYETRIEGNKGLKIFAPKLKISA